MEYQHSINGWELLDTETMLYSKKLEEGFAFIDMTWMDLTRADPEYGTGREYVVCTSEEDSDDQDEALYSFQDLHHTDSCCISQIVTRKEAEQIILEYIAEH